MLQKLGKKHRLLPAGPLWPGELAHWRTRGLSSPELPVLLLGNIKGLGTVLLRRACQPLSLSVSPPFPLQTVEEKEVTVWDGRGVFDGYALPLLCGFLRHVHLSPVSAFQSWGLKQKQMRQHDPLSCPGGQFESEVQTC